jgi:hypothetical protein
MYPYDIVLPLCIDVGVLCRVALTWLRSALLGSLSLIQAEWVTYRLSP